MARKLAPSPARAIPAGREAQSPRVTALSKWKSGIGITFGVSVVGTEYATACMPAGEYTSTSRRFGDATREQSLSVYLGYD